MFDFASTFITTLVIAICLAAIAIAGLFIGKGMKDRKNAKIAAEEAAKNSTEE